MKKLIALIFILMLIACEKDTMCWECTHTTIISYPDYPQTRMTVYMVVTTRCDLTYHQAQILNQQKTEERIGAQFIEQYTKCKLISQ